MMPGSVNENEPSLSPERRSGEKQLKSKRPQKRASLKMAGWTTMLMSDAISTAKGTKVSVIGLLILSPILIVALYKAPTVLLSSTGMAGLSKSILSTLQRAK